MAMAWSSLSDSAESNHPDSHAQGRANSSAHEAMSTEVVNPAMTSTMHPTARPNFRWRPDLVSGIPICRDSLALAEESPSARFHEKENPNFRPIGFLWA
jgi:hypothetical protein